MALTVNYHKSAIIVLSKGGFGKAVKEVPWPWQWCSETCILRRISQVKVHSALTGFPLPIHPPNVYLNKTFTPTFYLSVPLFVSCGTKPVAPFVSRWSHKTILFWPCVGTKACFHVNSSPFHLYFKKSYSYLESKLHTIHSCGHIKHNLILTASPSTIIVCCPHTHSPHRPDSKWIASANNFQFFSNKNSEDRHADRHLTRASSCKWQTVTTPLLSIPLTIRIMPWNMEPLPVPALSRKQKGPERRH